MEQEDGQRRDARRDVQWQAEVSFDDKSYDARIGNVSLAGVLTKTEAPLSHGDELILRIPDVGEFAGIVMWSDPPFFGLALMVGRELDLKRFTIGGGENVSDRPMSSEHDDWI